MFQKYSLRKNKLRQMINESVKILLEAKMDFENFYSIREGSDITEYILNYLSWCEMGKTDAEFSMLASKLHRALMRTLGLYHDETHDKVVFARILRYLRILKKHVKIKSVCIYRNYKWLVNIENTNSSNSHNEKNYVVIDSYDFYDNEISDLWNKAIVFETSSGVKRNKTDYRHGSYNGSSGYYTTSAIMTDEMKQKIYSMGLVPALHVLGSYHENFIDSVGVLPEMVSVLKRIEDEEGIGLYFDCKFVE